MEGFVVRLAFATASYSNVEQLQTLSPFHAVRLRVLIQCSRALFPVPTSPIINRQNIQPNIHLPSESLADHRRVCYHGHVLNSS